MTTQEKEDLLKLSTPLQLFVQNKPDPALPGFGAWCRRGTRLTNRLLAEIELFRAKANGDVMPPPNATCPLRDFTRSATNIESEKKTLTKEQKDSILASLKTLHIRLSQPPHQKSKDFVSWYTKNRDLAFSIHADIDGIEPEPETPSGSLPETPNSEVKPEVLDLVETDSQSEATPLPETSATTMSMRIENEDTGAEPKADPYLDLVAAESERIQVDKERLAEIVDEYETGLKRLTKAGQRVCEAISAADAVLGELPAVADELSDALKSRYRSVEVLRKMVAKLGEKAGQLAVSNTVPTEFAEPGPLPSLEPIEGWDARSQEYADREGQARYAVLTEVRRAGEGIRKTLTGFVEKQILPVTDAIDDGVRYSTELKVPDGQEHVDRLIHAYSVAQARFSAALEDLGVKEIVAVPGEPIDYERHEPFDVEPHDEMPDESIVDTFRKGYIFYGSYILRPAQVVVVRNAKDGEE